MQLKEKRSNIVYIASSIDGYIADKNNEIDWLHQVDNPQNNDAGFKEFISSVHALVMGSNTFKAVEAFAQSMPDFSWPYPCPVFVASRTMQSIPAGFKDKAQLVQGDIEQILAELNAQGYARIYIDGGKLIQQALKAQLIDEMIISQIPVLLGGGVSLFGELTDPQWFRPLSSTLYFNQIVQSHFKKV